MTPKQALVNLKEYYCQEQDHHSYIRESWQTLELAVKNLTSANKPNLPCSVCDGFIASVGHSYCSNCGTVLPR